MNNICPWTKYLHHLEFNQSALIFLALVSVIYRFLNKNRMSSGRNLTFQGSVFCYIGHLRLLQPSKYQIKYVNTTYNIFEQLLQYKGPLKSFMLYWILKLRNIYFLRSSLLYNECIATTSLKDFVSHYLFRKIMGKKF